MYHSLRFLEIAFECIAETPTCLQKLSSRQVQLCSLLIMIIIMIMMMMTMTMTMTMTMMMTTMMTNLFRQHWSKSTRSVKQQLHLAGNVPGGQHDHDDHQHDHDDHQHDHDDHRHVHEDQHHHDDHQHDHDDHQHDHDDHRHVHEDQHDHDGKDGDDNLLDDLKECMPLVDQAGHLVEGSPQRSCPPDPM